MLSSFDSKRPRHQHATLSRVYGFELLHPHASGHQLARRREACRKARRTVHGRPQELRAHRLVTVAKLKTGNPGSRVDSTVHRSRKDSQAVVHSALRPTDETGWKRMLWGAV